MFNSPEFEMKDFGTQEPRGGGVAISAGTPTYVLGAANWAICCGKGEAAAGAVGSTATAMHMAMQQLLPILS
jgi:hypothetical protein